jgi:hypothetical protein
VGGGQTSALKRRKAVASHLAWVQEEESRLHSLHSLQRFMDFTERGSMHAEVSEPARGPRAQALGHEEEEEVEVLRRERDEAMKMLASARQQLSLLRTGNGGGGVETLAGGGGGTAKIEEEEEEEAVQGGAVDVSGAEVCAGRRGKGDESLRVLVAQLQQRERELVEERARDRAALAELQLHNTSMSREKQAIQALKSSLDRALWSADVC